MVRCPGMAVGGKRGRGVSKGKYRYIDMAISIPIISPATSVLLLLLVPMDSHRYNIVRDRE